MSIELIIFELFSFNREIKIVKIGLKGGLLQTYVSKHTLHFSNDKPVWGKYR